jgi:catechol 2,3-dioxygenase-like lactoylglutathione lyase family enzyme
VIARKRFHEHPDAVGRQRAADGFSCTDGATHVQRVEERNYMKILGIDHVVFNVTDVERSLAFYQGVLHLPGERVSEFRDGSVPFPSVRVSNDTIIDLFPREAPHASDAEQRTNHICLVVDGPMERLEPELRANGIAIESGPSENFGARGIGTSVYVRDPDRNLIELRTYGS